MKCNRNRLHCQFNRNRRFRGLIRKSSPNIAVRWTAVLVTEFPPLSQFVMIMFEERPLVHLCGLNPDSPAASPALYRILALLHLSIGCQK